MADTMRLESKKNYIKVVSDKSWKKIEEVKEFLDLLEAKIECEFKHAEALDGLSKFHLNHLKGTPFENICKSIIRKADNESYQTYELVESLKNAVYEPLKTKVKDYADRIDTFEDKFESECKKLTDAREKLVDADCQYMIYSKSLSEIVTKIGFNSKNYGNDFYDSKMFSTLNSKMKSVDKRAKVLKTKTETINEHIEEFKANMKENIKDLEALEEERLQSIMDSLYQINVYQTNCDMNNKYDANNFNEAVDNIDTKEAKDSFNELCRSDELRKIDTYTFKPFDELISEDDVIMSKISIEEEKALNEKVAEFIDKCKTLKSEISSDDKAEFTTLMNEKINRFSFVNTLVKSEQVVLDGQSSYENLSCLTKIFLKSCDKNEDSDYLRTVLNVSSKYYYDIEEEDSVIRTYITEGIRDSKIWDNHILWGKAIFKDFRDIIRKFKLPKDHDPDLDEQDILRNVLFNRLMLYVDKLVYFDMKTEHLRTICRRFTREYAFSQAQVNQLSKKVSFDEIEQDEENFFNEETKQQRKSGSITKNMTNWMTQLNKFGSTAVNRMKTYIKKKEVEEDPVPDLQEIEADLEKELKEQQDAQMSEHSSPEKISHRDCQENDENSIHSHSNTSSPVKDDAEQSPDDEKEAFEEKDENQIGDSTDTSKNNSECSPPKDLDMAQKEVDYSEISKSTPATSTAPEISEA